ncbi:MAG: hypothetical protein C0453_08900 [Comamonadaceae bacterium]|nr:hypothetical protein [Comamonadaceae bacterium]
MIRFFAQPVRLLSILVICTFIPVVMAAVHLVQIPFDALPEDSVRLTAVPLSHFFHALGGFLFGALGPLQFFHVLRCRFGTFHRVAGRVFVLAGLALAVSGLSLLLQVESVATQLLDAARGVFSLALTAALILGVAAAWDRRLFQHRIWMIRAYAIGMGSGTVALVMFPIYLITGEPVMGLASDIVVVGVWLLNIAIGERVIWSLSESRTASPAAAMTNNPSTESVT